MNCGSSPHVDDKFTAFADVSRRVVLSTLCERSSADGPSSVDVETLAAELAFENGRGGRDERADGGRPDRPPSVADAKIELVHVHIPGLERAELVESDGEEVRLVAEPDVVEEGLELAEKFEESF